VKEIFSLFFICKDLEFLKANFFLCGTDYRYPARNSPTSS